MMTLTDKIEEFNHNTAEKSGDTGKKGWTPEKLRTLEGLGDITDSEAEELMDSINIFCSVLYDFLVHSENPMENTKTNLIKTAA